MSEVSEECVDLGHKVGTLWQSGDFMAKWGHRGKTWMIHQSEDTVRTLQPSEDIGRSLEK